VNNITKKHPTQQHSGQNKQPNIMGNKQPKGMPEGPPPIAVISGSTTNLPMHHDGGFVHHNQNNMVTHHTTTAASDSLALSETEVMSMPTAAVECVIQKRSESSEPDTATASAAESASNAEEKKSIKTNSCSSVSGMTVPDVAIVLVHSEVKSPAELTVDLTTE